MHDPDSFPVGEAANEAANTGAANGEAGESTNVIGTDPELQQAIARADQNYDLFLRAKADAENVRRRGQDEVAKAYKFAIESFAEGLVPVVDSLENAMRTQSMTPEAMREGIELTLRQLKTAFARGNLKEIDPAGEKFDPHFHQAISMVAADGVAPNHVVAVLQKGWLIADRVLRPALVTVAQA